MAGQSAKCCKLNGNNNGFGLQLWLSPFRISYFQSLWSTFHSEAFELKPLVSFLWISFAFLWHFFNVVGLLPCTFHFSLCCAFAQLCARCQCVIVWCLVFARLPRASFASWGNCLIWQMNWLSLFDPVQSRESGVPGVPLPLPLLTRFNFDSSQNPIESKRNLFFLRLL